VHEINFNGIPRLIVSDSRSKDKCALVFPFPILLQAEVCYELSVLDLSPAEQLFARVIAQCSPINPVWKNSLTNIHFLQGNATGDIIGFALGKVAPKVT
jgi:hypothetical protein